MENQNDIRVSNQLNTVDELAEESLLKGWEEHAWQDPLEYGCKTGESSGYAEKMCLASSKNGAAEPRHS